MISVFGSHFWTGEGKKCLLRGTDKITEQLREQHLCPMSLARPGQSQSIRTQSGFGLSSSVGFHQVSASGSRAVERAESVGQVQSEACCGSTAEIEPLFQGGRQRWIFGLLSQPQHQSGSSRGPSSLRPSDCLREFRGWGVPGMGVGGGYITASVRGKAKGVIAVPPGISDLSHDKICLQS